MKLSHLALLAALLLFAAGCAGTQPNAAGAAASSPAAEDAPPTYSDVQSLVEDTFAPLLTEDDELDASSWQSLIEGGEHGTVVIPYDADHSLLVNVAEHARAEGRPGAPSEAEIERVRAWIEAGARSDAGTVPYADAENRLYVANEAGALVTVIDTDAHRVIGTVDLTERGFSENAKPHDTAVTPDGEYWYLSLIGANRVLKFNRDNEIVGQVEIEVPGLLDLDPDSGRLFVGRSMGAVNPPKSIAIVDGDDLSVQVVDVFFPRPHAIGVDPTGQHAYVASLARNQVAGIDVESGQVELTSMGGPVNTLVHFAASPDGQTLAAGGQISGKFFFFDVASESPLTPRPTDSLQLGGQPWHPIYTPDGERLYVPQKTANAVSVIDAASRSVEKTLRHPAIALPHGSAVRPDGRYLYVTGSNVEGTYAPPYDVFGNEPPGTVVVIDTRTNEVVEVLWADQDPSGLSVRAQP